MNQQPPQQQPDVEYDDEIDLVDYIQVLIKRKRFILLTTLFCVIAGGIYSWQYKTYEAQTLILLSLKVEERSGSQNKNLDNPRSQLIIPTLAAETYADLATTDALAHSLRDSIAVAWRDSATSHPSYSLNAELKGGAAPSQLLTFEVRSPDHNVPVSVVNAWTRLFVDRNRGLSSGVARSYYDWVSDQYDIARTNLIETEKALQFVQAKYHNLSIIRNEVALKTTQLDLSLKDYQSMQVELESKLRERNYLQNLLSDLEVNGEWIGFLLIDALPPQQRIEDEQASIRKSLILLQYELAKLEQDSIVVSQKHQDEHLALQTYVQDAHLQFSRDTQIDMMRKHIAGLSETIDAFRTEFLALEQEINANGIELEVYRQNLEKTRPTLVLSKAITDNALWEQVSHNGRVSENRQTDLGRYKLQSEEVNPVYQNLSTQLSNAQVRRDMHQQRLAFLKEEIPALLQAHVAIQRQMDSLQVKEQDLDQRLDERRFALGKQMESEKMSLLAMLQRRRQGFEDQRAFYLERKQRQETLNGEIQRIQADLDFQAIKFANWRDETQQVSTIADSLGLESTQLERDVVIYRDTFQRFSQLLEQARISLQQAAGDIQVVSWAADVNVGSGMKYFVIIVLAGGMFAVFMAFVLEYVEKAQARLKDGS